MSFCYRASFRETKLQGVNRSGIDETLRAACQSIIFAFVNRFEGGKIRDVDILIDRENLKAIDKARKILPSIIDTVVSCGHMGISLRGHRDERANHPEAGQYSDKSGLGNFIELINFAIRRGDKVLEDHYINAPKNAHYLV